MMLVCACVDTVEENDFQIVHVYTDIQDSLDSSLFNNFEKQSGIHVFVHRATAPYILNLIKTQKWQSEVDAVLLSNAMDLIELSDEGAFHRMNEIDEIDWQPLFSNPFVFSFPNDTVPLFTSYGQLFRNYKSRVDPKHIKSFEKWGNLIPGLKKNYLIYSLAEIQSKILYSDTLKGKDILNVEIAPFSHYKDKSKIVFPDQFYKGAIGIIGGIGLIKQSKNRSNAILLFDYCQNTTWRKRLAKDIKLFPILDVEGNKSRDILLFQDPPNLKAIKNKAD
ncbi:MAG: hypothetical protein ACSHXL_06580 [Bacteroidota bacterium]